MARKSLPVIKEKDGKIVSYCTSCKMDMPMDKAASSEYASMFACPNCHMFKVLPIKLVNALLEKE